MQFVSISQNNICGVEFNYCSSLPNIVGGGAAPGCEGSPLPVFRPVLVKGMSIFRIVPSLQYYTKCPFFDLTESSSQLS